MLNNNDSDELSNLIVSRKLGKLKFELSKFNLSLCKAK